MSISDNKKFSNKIPDYLKARLDGQKLISYGGQEKRVWSEEYKWEVLPRLNKEFIKGGFTEDNILEKIKLLQKNNPTSGSFVSYMSLDDFKKAAEINPKKIAELFNGLLYSKNQLAERIDVFIEETRKIKPGAKLGTPLFGYIFAAFDCNNYPVYKDEIFMGVKEALGTRKEWQSFSIGEKYQKFNELCLEMGRYFKDNGSLKEVVVDGVRVAPGYKALDGQDFLYVSMFIDINEVNYWIFQGNPTRFDVIGALKKGGVDDWSINQGRNDIKIGDKVFFWISGSEAGLYGSGEVLTEPSERVKSDFGDWFVDIKYTNFLGDSYIPRQTFLNNKILKESRIIKQPQGTNFLLTKLEKNEIEKIINSIESKTKYWTISPGEDARMWPEFYEKGIIGIGWDDLGDLAQYQNQDQIKIALGKIYKESGENQTNNTKACYEFSRTMDIGDYLFVKKGLGELLGYGEVISDYIFDDLRNEYKHIRKVKWIKNGSWMIPKNSSPSIKTLTNITGDKDYIETLKNLMNINSINKTHMAQSKNLILYGPPGTGKTYTALKKAEELLSGQANVETEEERVGKIIKELTWVEVIGVIMRLREKNKYRIPELINDIVAKAAAKLKNRTSKLNPTFWSLMQLHSNEISETIKITRRSGWNLFDKDDKSEWYLTDTGKEYFADDRYNEIIKQLESTKVEKKDWKEYCDFITFHQSYSYEEFIEGIRPVLDDEEDSVRYELKDGVFKRMCRKAEQDKDNNYLLIIDEINRGNISKIFGELLTLVEEDKRSGGDNQITITLPYSGQAFSVPANLYILGTMNTADRSIALLDVALRRRFKFEELMPEYKDTKLDSLTVGDLNLGRLLRKINSKIEIMVDRDHQIGHSYFMKIDKDDKAALHDAWYGEVIPLLQEYFYNDWAKLELILGKYNTGSQTGFIEAKDNDYIRGLFPDNTSEDYLDSLVGSVHKYESNALVKALENLL